MNVNEMVELFKAEGFPARICTDYQVNVQDGNGVVHSFYTTGTIVFHKSNSRYIRDTITRRDLSIQDAIKLLNNPNEIFKMFKEEIK